MTFGELNAAVVDLRNSLHSSIGDSALEEITVRPPAGNDDEASFLRLIAWGYVLVFEAGRVTFRYLPKALPKSDGSFDPNGTHELVHSLRTWGSHNLGLARHRDAALFQLVRGWFSQTCGTFPPRQQEEWSQCFEALCTMISELIAICQDSLSWMLSDDVDGASLMTGFQHRLNRDWPAAKFDEIVSDVSGRLGIALDASKFREPRLQEWRRFLLSVAEGDDPHAQITYIIERDVLNCSIDILPIDGRDVMNSLGIKSGPEVGLALFRARELVSLGLRDRSAIIRRLELEYRESGASVSSD